MLPAASILMIYVTLINFGQGRKVSKLREELASQQRRAVTQGMVANVHHQKVAAGKERDRLAGELDQTQHDIDASLARFTSRSPADRMLQIDQLCRSHSIGVLGQKSTSNAKVSKLRRQSLRTLRKLTSEEIAYRQLDVVGRYGDVVALLKQLPESVDGVVPLGIELVEQDKLSNDESTSSGQRMWRIFLLM